MNRNEAFMVEFDEAMMTDDEPGHKKARRIISMYDNSSAEIQDIIDDVFITLCGYSVKTLKDMADKGGNL